ncbi:uncharacterized protein LOC115021812 [Cottoperca gobio]|uniref:Uncharacterized protein LOC115021812 n=1 Tax=Cottoperca gobio TaxID=56716 RepID=A0A6J2RBY8_COTGO|nr:uncharacterized protein LOC115021812 [Cottoperca gobio]
MRRKMARITIKQDIKKCLKDLCGSDFLTFCHELHDSKEEVSLSDVENKSILQITNLLVSIFTERKASDVVVDILKQMNCNDEAEKLHAKTRVCVDKGVPTFRRTSTGELETKLSQEALNHADGQLPLKVNVPRGPRVKVKTPDEVEAEAKALVLSEGGDPSNESLVLSRHKLQFGKYKGKTFQWLLENNVGYIAYLVNSHQKDERDPMHQDSLMTNKDSLTQYYERSLQSDQEGQALAGFGKYKDETLQELYESKDVSYVNYLRRMKSKCNPGSKMEVAVRYILKRDEIRAAAAAGTNRPKNSFTPQAARKTYTRRKRVQSTRDQRTSAPWFKRRKL